MKNGLNISISLFLIFLILIAPLEFPAQCAMCKEAAETSLKDNPRSMARSLNSGILYLLIVPYLALAFVFRKQIAQLWRSKFGKIKSSDLE